MCLQLTHPHLFIPGYLWSQLYSEDFSVLVLYNASKWVIVQGTWKKLFTGIHTLQGRTVLSFITSLLFPHLHCNWIVASLMNPLYVRPISVSVFTILRLVMRNYVLFTRKPVYKCRVNARIYFSFACKHVV